MHLSEKLSKWKLDYVAVFFISSLYYGRLQWNSYIGDPDGFYHAKIALFLRQGTVLTELPWMQTSTLRDNFTDHHLLYHIFLAPFTYIVDPLVGTKVATVFFSVLMVLGFLWLLKKMHTKWPVVFTLLLLTLEGLNFRLSLVKANSLSLLFIWIIIYALIQKKYWLLAISSAGFVWLYGGWPLALVILASYLISDFVYRKIHQTKFRFISERIHRWLEHGHNHRHFWKLPTAMLGGLAFALVINPYWPDNLYFYYQQIIQIGLINLGDKFNVGGEWYGTSIFHIMSTMPHIFVVATLCFIILFYNLKKIRIVTFFSFLLAFGFIILTIKSRRYIEYSAPFTLLFTACATTDVNRLFKKEKLKKLWEKLPIFLKVFLWANAGVLAVVILPLVINKTLDTKMPTNWPMNKFADSAQWLHENAPEKALVFQSDWDEWPSLFYHNDRNYYMIGLDFTFMYNYDPHLQQEFINISTGNDDQNLADKIKNDFGATYIFVDYYSHEKLILNLEKDSQIEKVFQGADSIIFKVSR